MGFRLALPNKTVIRKPDFGIVLHTNSVEWANVGTTEKINASDKTTTTSIIDEDEKDAIIMYFCYLF